MSTRGFVGDIGYISPICPLFYLNELSFGFHSLQSSLFVASFLGCVFVALVLQLECERRPYFKHRALTQLYSKPEFTE